nr:uncharacterized protein LOC127308217 isoform X1 [Lolium perenne]
MAEQASEVESLERILSDVSADPTRLAYGLIKSITSDFSTEIGRGAFGVVYLGTLPNGMVAVKKLSILQDFSDDRFHCEVDCLLKTKHNNIVRFLGYCADTQGELVEHKGRKIMAEVRQRFLCFEYVPNRSLRHYLKEKPQGNEWKTRYGMMKGICQGLQYLHKERINHLDLKPENVLLGAGMEPKITDFGLSRCFDEDHSRTFVKCTAGTRGYIAPEMIEKGEISFKSDIFSLGVIFINLLTRSDNNGDDNWHNSVDVDGPEVEICIEIARTCVEFDQHKRPSIYEINHRLNEMESVQEAANNQMSSIDQNLPPSVSPSCIDNQDSEKTKMESSKQGETSYGSGMGHPRDDGGQCQTSSKVAKMVPQPQQMQMQVNGLNPADSRMRDAKSVKIDLLEHPDGGSKVDGQSGRDDGLYNNLHDGPEMAMNAVAVGMPAPWFYQGSRSCSMPAGVENLPAAGGSMAQQEQERIARIQHFNQLQLKVMMMKGGHGGAGHVPSLSYPMMPRNEPSQVKQTPPRLMVAVPEVQPPPEDDSDDDFWDDEWDSDDFDDEDLSSARGGGNKIPLPISKNNDPKSGGNEIPPPISKNEKQSTAKESGGNRIPPPISKNSENEIHGQTTKIATRGDHSTGGNHPGIVTNHDSIGGRWRMPQQQHMTGNMPPSQMGGNGWAGDMLRRPLNVGNGGYLPPVPQVSGAAENYMAYMQLQHMAYMQQQQLAFYYQSSFLLVCAIIIIVLVIFQVPVNRCWE